MSIEKRYGVNSTPLTRQDNFYYSTDGTLISRNDSITLRQTKSKVEEQMLTLVEALRLDPEEAIKEKQ